MAAERIAYTANQLRNHIETSGVDTYLEYKIGPERYQAVLASSDSLLSAYKEIRETVQYFPSPALLREYFVKHVKKSMPYIDPVLLADCFAKFLLEEVMAGNLVVENLPDNQTFIALKICKNAKSIIEAHRTIADLLWGALYPDEEI